MKYFRILQFWLLLFLGCYLSLSPAPPQIMQVLSDKLLHAAGYLTLYISCSLAYFVPAHSIRNLLLLLVFSSLIEIAQQYIPNRSFSYFDILANAVGLLLGLFLVRLFQAFLQPKTQKVP